MSARFHRYCLIAFAIGGALLEGPAQLAALLVIVSALALHGLRALHPGWTGAFALLWLLSGLGGLAGSGLSPFTGAALSALSCAAFLAGRAIVRQNRSTLRTLALVFLAACAVNALYGMMQVWIYDPPLQEVVLRRASSAELTHPDGSSRLLMATGIMYSRLRYAHVLVIGLALGLLLSLRPAPGRRADLRLLVTTLVIAVGLFLSYRRGAPAALCLACIIVAPVLRRWRIGLAGLVTGLVVGLLFVATEYGRTRVGSLGFASAERMQIAGSALALFAENPLFGVGHGAFAATIGPFWRSAPELRTSPHNLYLSVLCETGLVGMVGFVGAVGLSLRGLLQRLRGQHGLPTDLFVLIGLLTYLILGGAHSILFHPMVALLFWTLLGMADPQARDDHGVN